MDSQQRSGASWALPAMMLSASPRSCEPLGHRKLYPQAFGHAVQVASQQASVEKPTAPLGFSMKPLGHEKRQHDASQHFSVLGAFRRAASVLALERSGQEKAEQVFLQPVASQGSVDDKGCWPATSISSFG